MTLRRVFEPITVGGVEIPNRIVRTGHVTGLGDGGGVTADLIAYHEARAAGGVGLLYLEHSTLDRLSPSPTIVWSDDRLLPGFRRLADAVHRHGARVFQQVLHRGPHCVPPDGSAPLAASAGPVPAAKVVPRAATADDIRELIQAHCDAGRRARDGGLDGVEVLAGHGYLIHSFLSPRWNRREDCYGGSTANRARLLNEILAAMRAALPGFPLGVRLSATEHVDGGMDPDEVRDLARQLERDGLIDFVNLSVGGYSTPAAVSSMIGPMHEPHGYQLDLTEPIAAALSVPSIVTGRIVTLAEAEAVLERGNADLVSMVRATIADPDIVRKTRAGHADQVRPCIGCNQGCIGGIWGPTRRLGCVVNVRAGHEAQSAGPAEVAAGQARHVLVIGGGPGGLEAARAAAEAGHDVTLMEREAALGGQLRYALTAPHRSEIGAALAWWESELRRLGVRVELESAGDETVVDSYQPDAVVVATGARPTAGLLTTRSHPEGVRRAPQARVLSSVDVAAGLVDAQPRQDVVVIDEVGHYEALGAAETLATAGHQVTFVTADPEPGAKVDAAMTAAPTVARLAGAKVRFLPGYQVDEIGERSVRVSGADEARTLPADAVVFVGGAQAEDSLARRLGQLGLAVHLVGDAAQPRDMQAAIREGYLAAMAISEQQGK
jgi:2,4-dienoyl-CoA reductase-like NADH-dependent reductase (Old Yellow Enzyme family)/thioredoxin reductase